MNGFALPTLTAAQAPAFDNARGCRAWLSAQPLTNAAQAQALLLRQINLLNAYPVAPAERLKILEMLREPIAFAQAESARRFAGRPLPLAPAEQAAMDANRTLWQAIQTGYLHCLVACQDGDADLRPHAGLIAQRAIGSLRAELIDIYRAPTDPPERLWQLLHRIYAVAESLDALTSPVSDSQQGKHPSTNVDAAYVQTLLLQRANPYTLSGRELLQVDRWLSRWGARVAILKTAPAEPRVPPLVVDLASGVPEAVAGAKEGSRRWLDLSDLSRSLKKRIVNLHEGKPPSSLGLGEDCIQPGCEALLRQLYQQWFKGGASRTLPRHAGHGICRLVTGFEAINYYLSGKVFRQPVHAADLSKLQHDEIATFGRIATRHEDDYSQAHGFMIEEWRILDESATGFRLGRGLAQGGGRIGGNQLVAVQPGSTSGFMLAVVCWSRIAGGSELLAGINVLPGSPLTGAVRGTGLPSANEKFRPCFLLPEVPAVKEPRSIIVPAGWFRPGRVVEVSVSHSSQLRLGKILDRGSDFERATYEGI